MRPTKASHTQFRFDMIKPHFGRFNRSGVDYDTLLSDPHSVKKRIKSTVHLSKMQEVTRYSGYVNLLTLCIPRSTINVNDLSRRAAQQSIFTSSKSSRSCGPSISALSKTTRLHVSECARFMLLRLAWRAIPTFAQILFAHP